MNRRQTLKLGLATLFFPAAFAAHAATIPTPPSGQGLIVMYRPRKAKGGGLRFPLTLNGMQIGNLRNGSVMSKIVDPGQYTVQTTAPSVDGTSAVSVTVKAGETVFVRGDTALGYPTWRAQLFVMPPAQGQAAVAKM